jgi:hypothetical protein
VSHLRGQQTQDAILQLGADILGAIARIDRTVPASAPVALSQLPAALRGFTGREADMEVLGGLLDPAGPAGAVVVSAVAGLAGVGKTTLAVQAGHAARARGWYPGGVLFVDLHGYDDQPVEPAQALDALLRALGVPTEHIPPGTDERAGLYRSALARVARPVLVIADNASSEAQVRPLLPGAGPHAVVVTSRHTLAGLGARLIDVSVLDDGDAIALVDAALRAARPADDRITGDMPAAGRLAGACGGLPLALQITAAILIADQSLTAAELAGELSEEQAAWGGWLTVTAAVRCRSRRRSSCPPAGWMRVRRGCSGCWPPVPARTFPPPRRRSWPTCRPTRREGGWRTWAGRTWPGPRPARRAGGGCTTWSACTPGSCPTPAPTAARRPSPGCWTGSSTPPGPPMPTCERCLERPFRRSSPGGRRPWTGWTPNGLR